MYEAVDNGLNNKRARCVVIGNEKGGSGKSTTVINLIFGLIDSGYSVICVDLDFRQRTLSRFLECRAAYGEAHGKQLRMPDMRRFSPSALGSVATARGAELSRFDTFMKGLQTSADYIVIDTPGNDTVLGAHAHSHADILVTPINDSFIDLDVIVRLSPLDMHITGPGHYTESVWEQRTLKQARDKCDTEWIVLRNRLGALESNNKRSMDAVMRELVDRFNFNVLPGFGERVIFRELFLKGLTLFDVSASDGDNRRTMSHVAAKHEVRNLLGAVIGGAEVKSHGHAAA
ncbi:MAG: division plane positioning ATPase MipZ [Alphaproteobacteria bacterium]|jgi:chromosome partitioning protein|nr:division plane positioning ATPase MipZ [Alphaproteobacteria bacterium]MDH5556564.1 division plane positioning ATPase MipZ [Alphaproteobacteria bacterium]